MIKKPQIVGILFVIAIFLLVSIAAKSDNQAGIQSKVSHAEELWESSGHAHEEAEAFRHWDEDGEIPTSCAKCHSTPGYIDYIEDGVVNSAVQPGTTVECEVCHFDFAIASLTLESLISDIGKTDSASHSPHAKKIGRAHV